MAFLLLFKPIVMIRTLLAVRSRLSLDDLMNQPVPGDNVADRQ